MSAHDRQSKIKSVFIVSSGNFLEMYDFMVFGYYATAIARTFFPSSSEYASLMLSLMTFGAGFLMRPLGAIFLGAYLDRHGRRAGLLLTLGLMAIGTMTIAFMPGYESIGLVAPVLVLVGRLLQGLSAGVEVGGVSVYLSEIATKGNKGFYVSWQSASQQVAVVFAAVIGLIVTSYLTREEMLGYGWRIPLIIGCVIIPFIFAIRRSLTETDEFLARKHRPRPTEVFRSLRENWQVVILGTMMATMTTVSFYFITAYTPTFGTVVLGLDAKSNMIVILCVGLTNFTLLPLMGGLSDRIGRRPLLITCSLLAAVTAYPALSWLVAEPSFTRLLLVELWLAVVYAGYNGAMIVYLTEIVPVHVRTAGFSLAYSLATALFGGFTPAICTYLIQETGNRAVPAVWLGFSAICGLAATLMLGRRERLSNAAQAAAEVRVAEAAKVNVPDWARSDARETL
jgi:MFS family permease